MKLSHPLIIVFITFFLLVGLQDKSFAAFAYPGVPLSSIYSVSTTENETTEMQSVFINSCPLYQAGYMDMTTNDQYPLDYFKGRSINWVHFSKNYPLTVTVKVTDISKVPVAGNAVHVWPSRFGIIPTVSGNNITFTLTVPGQYSVEIGDSGYKNGLMIFANPVETNVPAITDPNFLVLDQATAANITSIPPQYTGVYFKPGVHNVGVFNIPANIKSIYFAEGSWVYGTLKMDGDPNVKIYGRGTLSSGKLNYRESHGIEAVNGSDGISIEGITVADLKYFGIRLIGKNNVVKWTNVIGGWTYNCDGIAAYDGSTVSNCFIWANDDAIKVYRNNIHWNDCVVWQLNNGGIIQMSWGNSTSQNAVLSRIDVLRAEWNKPGFNRALISCVGNHYQTPGSYSLESNWLIEDVITETEIPVVFGITPDPFTPNDIHGLTLKNWNVKMTMGTSYQNAIKGNNPAAFFDGFVFDNFVFNNTLLTKSNWHSVTVMDDSNLVTPLVLPDVSGVSVPKTNALMITPNPALNSITIKGVSESNQYQVFCSTGACVLNGKGSEVNVSSLESGMYMLSVDTNRCAKFLKK